MKNEQIGYGIIGLGTVAGRHIRCVKVLPGARLAAVSDIQVERSRELCGRLSDSPRPFQDYRDLLADPAVDAVVICLPTHLHAEATVAAARAGKHVFCEKAMAPTLRDGRRMIEAAAAAGVKLTIGQSTRFHPIHQHLRRLVESGRIGEIVACECHNTNVTRTPDTVPVNYHWRYEQGARGHGLVINQACHAIDTLRFLSGQNPVRISAMIGNRYSGHVDPEDQYGIQAVCDGRALMTLSEYGMPAHANTRNNGYFLYGSRGVLSYRFADESAITVEGEGKEAQSIPVAEDLQAEDAFFRLHRLFYESITRDAPVPVSGEEGLMNLHCVLGAYAADSRRQWMELPLGEEWQDFYGPEREATLPGKV